ncbi:hypothetical protein [Neisseria montereyensis]|uniref:Uncharacterized protein n=1 Tax=Neisseria montereyensis TaxID=2973938 RepID=A0ABT2FBQ1_9NEIS|nr:hypothetical protein [Neisseria montereyensis]MCS4533646.1 hypothetical protein [Neisseria montereyensis]
MKKIATAALVLAGLGLTTSAFAAGSFRQGVAVNSDTKLSIVEGAKNTQGLNVVNGSAVKVKDAVQEVVSNKDLELKLSHASYNTQGANVVIGNKNTDTIRQAAYFNKVDLSIEKGGYNTQGVNIVNLNK